MTAPLLQVEGLAVAAAGVTLVEKLDLAIRPGEIVALTGPSGCGKTTLLRALSLLADPAAGTIRLGGESPEAIGIPAYRRRVMLVPQEPALVDESVADALARPFRYRHGGPPFDSDKARRLLAEIGIDGHRWDQPARSLSVGQQQRICLARAVLTEPAVFLLDEPTAALDTDTVRQVETVLRNETRRRPCAILAVTHNPDQARHWADRTVRLSAAVSTAIGRSR